MGVCVCVVTWLWLFQTQHFVGSVLQLYRASYSVRSAFSATFLVVLVIRLQCHLCVVFQRQVNFAARRNSSVCINSSVPPSACALTTTSNHVTASDSCLHQQRYASQDGGTERNPNAEHHSHSSSCSVADEDTNRNNPYLSCNFSRKRPRLELKT